MKPFYICLFAFTLLGLTCSAARPAIGTIRIEKDELWATGPVKTDTSTVNRLNKLAEKHYESEPDSAAHYAQLAIKIAKQIKYTRGIANGQEQLGQVNSFQGQFKLADSNYNVALQLYKQLNDKLSESESYMGLGRVQDFLGNYTRAIALFEKALTIRKKLGNQIEIANCYAIIGITYDSKGDFSKALDYYFKSLAIDLNVNNDLAAADNYNNIGVVMQHLQLYTKALDYFDKANKIWLKLDDRQGISTASQNIGEVMVSLKKYNVATTYYRKALNMYLRLRDEEGISLVYYDIGMYHAKTNRPDSALYYLNLCLQSATKNKIPYNKAYAYQGFALIYNQKGDYKSGIKNALLARETANRIQSLVIRADATLQLSDALAGLKRFNEAYTEHRIYTALKDSLKDDESLQKLSSYNMAIDFENRQRLTAQKEDILEQKIAEQRVANIIYAVVIVAITILLVFYYNAKRKQLKANVLLEKINKQVITQTDELTDLNTLKDRLIGILAHDLRAPLSTLRGMFSLLADKDVTKEEFVEMVPGVFRKLENTSDFLDTLLFWINSQVDNVAQTTTSFCLCDIIKLELVHLEDQFKNKNITPVNTVTAGHIVLADPKSIRIVIHNFLTNAIKFSHQHSVIEINAKITNDKVSFCIKDHGVGMSTEQLAKLFKRKVDSQTGTMNETGTGMGLIFCKELIEKYSGTVWAKSTPGTGTEMGFTLAADVSRINGDLSMA